MTHNAGCLRLRLVALVVAASLLSSCAAVNSESVMGICPPVVEYSPAELAQAADEIASLPQNAVIIGWLSDYSVMRDQSRSCVR